jgi:hypothetical protein
MNFAPRFLPLVALSLLTGFASARAADDYEIKLNRPVKTGQRFKVAVAAKDSANTTVDANGSNVSSQRKDVEVEYEADVTILEVGPNGRSTRESHKVTRFIRLIGGEKVKLVEKGAVVVASKKNKKPSFEITGAAGSKDLNDALALVIDINDGTSPNEDEIIGTKDRKKIGESWPINKSMLEKLLSKDANLEMKDAGGELTLKEIVKDATGEAMVVEGTVKGKTSFPLAPGVNAKDSELVIKLSYRYPLDPALPRTQERNELTMNINASGKTSPDGPDVVIKVLSNRTVTRKLTLLK